MSHRLLATKFHIPPGKAGLVPRPRLHALLDAGLQEGRRLTVVSAPAGYGKTTLVAEWLSSIAPQPASAGGGDGPGVSWLSLEDVDNDPLRFLRYFLAAFRPAGQTIGVQAMSMLEMPKLPPLPNLLDDLLNDLAAIASRFVFVLDDYHVVANPEIHAALEYFIEHQPASAHLVLTSRADPPLPLARFRARRQMTEIRARDLRFTADEARTFFGLANLPLAENALRALDERTEGWAAGLQLAALALQSRSDPAAFIETFRGSHRYVLDYLAGEVLQQQSEAIRLFLTQTSLLTRFNADLCHALTGREDAQAVIAGLEQSNLFIIPLDDDRCWYRYHPLFADYLLSLLSKPEKAALYRKAAAWHAAQELTTDAVRYALLSGDPEFAARMIESALDKNATWSDGNLAMLTAWLEALPPQVIRTRPRLGLHAARVYHIQGRFEPAETHLDEAEQLLQTLPAAPDADELLALAALYRGAIAAVRGDFDRVIELIPPAQARLPRENHLAHARAFFSLGLAHEISGQTVPAVEHYLQSSVEARHAGVRFLQMHGLCSAAQLQIQQARLSLAAQTCRDAIQLAEGAHLPPLGLAWSILGTIALERDELPSAESYVQDGIALSRKGGLLDDLLFGLAALGRLCAYRGDLVGMQAAVEEAQSVIRVIDVPRAEQLAQAHLARYQHFLGRHEAAERWASAYQSIRTEPLHEFEELTLVRILISAGDIQPVPAVLMPVLEQANAAGRMQTALEAMLLLGLYHHACKETAAALEWLKKSLELAAPEGYRRIFLDEGPPLLGLLPRLRPIAPELVDAILRSEPAEVRSPAAPLDELPDPLSEQELRVLKLIVAGKSNAEIAAELVVTVGTAKWHVHNIFQKLGVNSRPRAIARARELGV